MSISRRRYLWLVASGAAALAAIGCGGGGSPGGRETTRKRVQAIDSALGRRSQIDPMMILAGFGGGMEGSGGGVADSLGRFLGANNLPPVGPVRSSYSRAKAAKTRAESNPNFYYDSYLQLWASKSETPTQTRYDFFEDEAKTKPGGFLLSEHPEGIYWPLYDPVAMAQPGEDDVSAINAPDILPYPYPEPTYPIVYRTTYEFTAGAMRGSKGFSESISNIGTHTSRYENTYSDGWKDRGDTRSDSGGSTWFSRIETPEGQFAEAAGSFRNSGGGGSRMSSSDGYRADYQFNANGGGHGRIEGPGEGLPVTVSWDAAGTVLIRYADGTTETIRRDDVYPIPLPALEDANGDP